MSRRIAVVFAAVAMTAGLVLGLAGAASAQVTPGTVEVTVACGPVFSDLTVNLTGGAPDTSYTATVTIAGIPLSVAFTTNAAGSAVAVLPVPTLLLDMVTGLLPVIIADGETPIVAPVAAVCGIL